MDEVDVPHGFAITARNFVPVSAGEFERALLAPASIAAWNNMVLTEPENGVTPLNVGDPMEFAVGVGPLSFDFVMIVASRVPGSSYTLRTTRGFVGVTVLYSWEARGSGTEVVVESQFRQMGSRPWKTPMVRVVARRHMCRAGRNMRDSFSPRRTRRHQPEHPPISGPTAPGPYLN